MDRELRAKRIAEWAEEVGDVDFDFLMSLVADSPRVQSATDRLIDRFLEVKDLRIEVKDEPSPTPIAPIEFQPSAEFESLGEESEELARIYHSQGMFREAKEIYNQLFLLYSEKIAYFATLLETLSSLEEAEVSEPERDK